MSSIFSPRRNPTPTPAGAGGKIVRNRRPPASERTPYARPKVLREEEETNPGNPNWFSGLIRPAKVIVSGAGKIVSAVFGPDSPSSSSSEEDSIGDSGDIDQTEDDLFFEENAQENKELSPRSTNKCLIEQLVSQEEFSREESEELIKLIQSRVVDDMTGKISGTAGTSHDVHSTAIIEARKWLQEKKLGSDSKSRSEHRTLLSSLGTLAQATESELGSPIDVAKSYMQARPPWASPSLKHVEFGTPSPSLLQQSFDEPPISILGSSLRSPELKRSAIATGAWNIMEEIRKVRSKATEELLASKSSETIDAPLLASKRKTSEGSLAYNGNEMTVDDVLYDWTSGIPDIETKAFVDLEALDHHGSSEINAHAENGPGESEANQITKTVAENGVLVSTSSLSVAIDGNKTLDLGGTKDAGIENGESKHENLTSNPVLENLTRDFATVNEEASMGSGSEGSTGMLPQEPSQASNQQDSKQRLAAKNNSTSGRGRRARAYTRRVKREK
ncbi:KAKU4-like protein [Drosera capensis]